jgi:hypothetical protein
MKRISRVVFSRVSNKTGQCNFSGQRDRSSLIVPGQRDKLKILPRAGTGWDSLSKSGTGCGTVQDFDSLSYSVPRDKTGQSRKGCSKQKKDVLKQKRMFSSRKMTF